MQESSSAKVACPLNQSSAAEGADEAHDLGGVMQPNGDLQGLIAAVNAVRSDMCRMANLLAGVAPGDERIRLPDRLSVDDRSALRLLASDMKRQSALVQDLTSVVANASDGGPLPNHADMLNALSALLSQTRSQLQDISPQFRYDQSLDLSIEHGPRQGEEALGDRASFETERAVRSPQWLVDENGKVQDVPVEDHATISSGLAGEMHRVVGKSVQADEDRSRAEANDETWRKAPPRALLQAALRDVLESSLLDVEAQISELQEIQANILVTDTSSATLDDWKPPPSKNARRPELGELVSLFIPFDDASAELDSRVNLPDMMPPSAVSAPEARATRDEDEDAIKATPASGAASERYTNFVDEHARDRAILAEKVRGKKSGSLAGRDPSMCAMTRQGASDDERMLQEYVQLSAEMEELCAWKLPGIISAVTVARSKILPQASAQLIAVPAVGVTNTVSLAGMPSRIRRQAPPAKAHARPVGGNFCSPLQRAAMAERLANKAAFCSPLDRAALAQELAAKAGFLQVHPSSHPADDMHEVLECLSADDQDTQPVDACEENVGESGLPDVQRALRAACQTLATDAGVCRRNVGVNTIVEMVAVAVGADESPVSASDIVQDMAGLQDAALDLDWRSVSSRGSGWPAPVAEDHIEMQENATFRLQEAMGAGFSGDQVVGLLREANRGVLDISRIAMQFSMRVSSSPISTECDAAEMGSCNGDASAGVAAAAHRAALAPLASACAARQPSITTCASDLRPFWPPGKEVAERPSGNGESPQEMYGKVVESVEGLTVHVRTVADLQASAAQGNQLLLEKTDRLLDGVKLGMGQIGQGQGSMTSAISELNCQLSQVCTHLMDLRQSATSPGSTSQAQVCQAQAQTQTQTQTHSQTQTPMHAETQTQEQMKQGRKDYAPNSCHAAIDASTLSLRHDGETMAGHGNGSSGALPISRRLQAPSLTRDVEMQTQMREGEVESNTQSASALGDLHDVISELQKLTAEIKSTQQRQVQQGYMALGMHGDVPSAREECRRAAGGGGARAPQAVDSARSQVADCNKSSVVREEDSDAELDLSGLNEMQEILSLLRQRAKSRGAGSSYTAADTELDLSSFPRGPS